MYAAKVTIFPRFTNFYKINAKNDEIYYLCGINCLTMNRDILRIAIPNIISNVTVPLMGIASTVIAGRVGGSDAATTIECTLDRCHHFQLYILEHLVHTYGHKWAHSTGIWCW